MAVVHFRFYAELNNFLAPGLRHRWSGQPCARDATVKHMVEALGVPHTEVELIVMNGESVDFGYRLREGDKASVFPGFSTLDVSPLVRVRPPLEHPVRFVADAHLGQLARHLRMLGFDVLYRNDFSDAEVASIAATEGRVVMTRDRALLIRKEIVYGAYIHATECQAQLVEVLTRYDLARAVRAFSRCLSCNGVLQEVDKQAVECCVPALSWSIYDQFYRCQGCDQVYWEGSHVERMRARLAPLLGGVDRQNDFR